MFLMCEFENVKVHVRTSIFRDFFLEYNDERMSKLTIQSNSTYISVILRKKIGHEKFYYLIHRQEAGCNVF